MNPYAVHNYLLGLSLASGLPAALLALTMYLVYGLFWFPTHLVDPLVWSLVGLGLVGAEAAALKQRPVPVVGNSADYVLAKP